MKIISGGQTGADRAGLDAARECRLQTGGFAPKYYQTEDGPDYSLISYNLIDSGLNYTGRTELNVIHSDITLWFGIGDSAGYKATYSYCLKYQKPFYNATGKSSDEIRTAINGYTIINIAGNRASKNREIYLSTYKTLLEVFKYEQQKFPT